VTPAANVQATFAATLVDEWLVCGVQDAVIAPGSRSTPLAVALATSPLRVHVHHDERAASFVALGIGKASGVPAVLLCTSGTAAAELHAAVVEAHQARVPMLVCTADRPPELQDVGAPQTIDQTHLYGRAVRWYAEPGVADDAVRGTWRSLAARAFIEATGRVPGPVHLNLAFRDPLVGESGPLPPRRGRSDPWHRGTTRGVVSIGIPDVGRGLIVAGAGATQLRASTKDIGWPILADPLSGWREPGTVGAFDAIIRARPDLRPELVVRVGDPPASKVLAQWLASLDAPQIALGDGWFDPDRTASRVGDIAHLEREGDREWLATWQDAERAAQRAIDEVLDAHGELTEPFVARAVAEHAGAVCVSRGRTAPSRISSSTSTGRSRGTSGSSPATGCRRATGRH
jgi:2-succinyl-5-enolpyruvyl-6-hydroxy-3-cyclohexene-1-carboxylate synthase